MPSKKYRAHYSDFCDDCIKLFPTISKSGLNEVYLTYISSGFFKELCPCCSKNISFCYKCTDQLGTFCKAKETEYPGHNNDRKYYVFHSECYDSMTKEEIESFN